MPTELEELVEFLHHGNTQIRQLAAENLVPYSKTQPTIFKRNQLEPVKDLKLLVRDYKPIAENALTILINISGELELLQALAEDEIFLESILAKITSPQEPLADALSSLLANLTKSPSLSRLATLKRPPPPSLANVGNLAIAQLLHIYNHGPSYNPSATFNDLAYVFSDLAQHSAFLSYLLRAGAIEDGRTTSGASAVRWNNTEATLSPSLASISDGLDPLTLILPLTTHPSPTRRLGTAYLLRNLCLSDISDPLYLLQPAHSILPPLLLPLCSSNQENFTEEEMELLPEECQYLPPTHEEERDGKVLEALVETIWLLAARGGEPARKVMKESGVYAVIREGHLRWSGHGDGNGKRKVVEWCEKIVDLLMGEEKDSGKKAGNDKSDDAKVTEIADDEDDEDEDNAIVPIF